MPTFNSVADLNKYINSSAGQRNVLGGTNVKKIMISEANRLKKCIQKRLDDYYNSYEPTVYNRTYQLQRSLQVDKNIIVVHHSDFEVPTFTNEKGDTTADINKLYEFITYTDFYDQFLSHLASKTYIDELNNMVGAAISFTQSRIDALINKLIDFVDTFSKQFDGLDANQLTEMISAIQVKETKSNVVELASQGTL